MKNIFNPHDRMDEERYSLGQKQAGLGILTGIPSMIGLAVAFYFESKYNLIDTQFEAIVSGTVLYAPTIGSAALMGAGFVNMTLGTPPKE